MCKGSSGYEDYYKGRLDQAIKSVIIVLNSKFGTINNDLEIKIKNTTDLMKLYKILRKVINFKTVDEVEDFL
jgi:hypothetical protein